MSTTLTYPGVYIEELPSGQHTITGVATSIAAFVGYTARGIDNRAQAVYSFADFERLYGGLASNSEVSYAVQQFFTNGGTQAYVVRTPMHYPTSGTPVPYAEVVIANGELTFAALSSGQWANNQLLVDVDVQPADRRQQPPRLLGARHQEHRQRDRDADQQHDRRLASRRRHARFIHHRTM